MKKLFGLTALAGLLMVGCAQPSSTNTANSTAPEPAEQIAKAGIETPASLNVDTAAEVSKPVHRFVSTQADTATLKAKFVVKGEVEDAEKIDGSRDPFCAALDIFSEKMVVGEGGAVRNLALYLDTRRTKIDLPEVAVDKDAKIVLDNKGCVFNPHMIVARPGQSITVTNSDGCGHNANFNFLVNPGVNFLIPAGGEKAMELKAAEPAPIPVDCNIHPWMRAYLIVTDHPYVGVTNEKGELEIANLPVGEVTFKVWHENSEKSIDEGMVNGKKEKWSRGRMEIELKPGVNDLGTITIDAGLFK